MNKVETPILQTGTLRSGSAMVSRILNAHSKIVINAIKLAYINLVVE